MFPGSITIARDGGDAGVLLELFRHSMSLQEAARRGAAPPLAILNEFLRCGVDDVEQGLGCCEVEDLRPDGLVLHWDPFELTDAEYAAFLDQLRARGLAAEVRDYHAADFGQWFSRCFEDPAAGL